MGMNCNCVGRMAALLAAALLCAVGATAAPLPPAHAQRVDDAIEANIDERWDKLVRRSYSISHRIFDEHGYLADEATAVETMKHKLKTRAGRAAYGLRKQTVEPVFGIIKSVMGFRQFLLRGLENVQNEWTLVCLAWNLKRMAVLRPQ